MISLDPKAFAEVAAHLTTWRRPLLITHARPDGDALGSMIAMQSMLRALGVNPTALLFEPWPQRYGFLTRPSPMAVLGAERTESDLADHDAVIILDTCSYAQLAPLANWLRAATMPKLAVDHHVTRDDLADLYLVDESAAANCLILHEWARAVGWAFDRETAEALFVGIAMDTGWFRHTNTDERVLACARDLVARGVRPSEVNRQLFQCESPARIRLLGAAISALELLARERLAVTTLTPESFAQTGATPADTEDIVNEPLRIRSVLLSVLLVDSGDGVIRASFRSQAPRSDSDPNIDVAAIARHFGGGGHTRAAGARITGSLADIRNQILEHAEQALASTPDPGSG